MAMGKTKINIRRTRNMKKIVSLLLTLAVMASLLVVPAVSAATYDSSLTLENKTVTPSPPWPIIPDGTEGTLDYNSTGGKFEYRFSATGLENSTEYSLIYYADMPDRFAVWGGDNPGALITTFTTGTSGNIAATAGSVELNMGLPCPPDANISEYDYCVLDGYVHCNGAKIWLVPSDCYTEPEVTTWAPSRFLFETDLIWYDDIGSSVGLTAGVEDIIAISVNPSSINFGTLIPGSTSSMKVITVKNMGTCTVDVGASVSGDDLFVDNLQMTNNSSWSNTPWNDLITELSKGNFDEVQTQLVVPSNYAPKGTETAILLFEARVV